MNRKTILLRILYTGAGLVLLVAILLPLVTIPFVLLDKTGTATPGNAIFGTLILVILHLLVLYAFREAIIVCKLDRRMKKVVFIVSGIGLLLMGLIILDGAVEFLGYYHNYLAAITLFFCIGCNFFAALIAFTALFLQPRNADRK